MTELFSSIKIEVLLGTTWTDLTPDVRMEPPPKVTGMGIMSNRIDQRVGDAAQFVFALDNSQGNSGGLLGYYTPAHVNCFNSTYWQPGAPVRLYFEYDGIRRYKFYGTIDVNGINISTGKYRDRTVTITCTNWMGEAANHTCDLLPYVLDARIDQAVPYILDNMRRKPLITEYHTGDEIFPDVFDIVSTKTKAMSELQKLAISEFGWIYMTGDGTGGETLIVENRNYRSTTYSGTPPNGSLIPVKNSECTDNLLMETGDDLLLEDGTSFILMEATQYANFDESDIIDMEVSYGDNVRNRVKFVTYPRNIDAAATTVLYNLESPIKILAAETLTEVRGRYRDPNGGASRVNGIDMVTPQITTDYLMFANEDGTGTNYTANLTVVAEYGTAEARYTLTNSSASTAYITKLQARGKGVYIYDTSDKIYDNAASQKRYGVIPMDIDMPYISNLIGLFSVGGVESTIWDNGSLLYSLNLPWLLVERVTLQVNKSTLGMMAFMYMEPPQLISLEETMSAVSGIYSATGHHIQGYDFEIIDGKYVNWSLVLRPLGIY